MHIYKLNIFKGTFQHELDTMQEGFFINLGLADYVQAEKINDFSQLVSYNPSGKIGEHRFLCSSMFIFDEVKEGAPLNPGKSGMPLLDTSLYKSNIFMICPIKLRLTSEMAPDAV